MRDLSEFQGMVPDVGPGEDEILNVIQLRRAAGEGCITVVTQITTSDAVVSEVEVTTGG